MIESGERVFNNARELLSIHSIRCDVSFEEFEVWMNAPTAYPDFSVEDVLGNPFLVAHEIAEIAEVKKMGIRITKDAILDNPVRIYEAHLKAFEVEMRLATEAHDRDHLASRLNDLRNWTNDPLLPPNLRPTCNELYAKTTGALSKMG